MSAFEAAWPFLTTNERTNEELCFIQVYLVLTVRNPLSR